MANSAVALASVACWSAENEDDFEQESEEAERLHEPSPLSSENYANNLTQPEVR